MSPKKCYCHIYCTKYIFQKGKKMRNVHLNSHNIISYKNPRDKSQVMHLARQMFPMKTRGFQKIFEDGQ